MITEKEIGDYVLKIDELENQVLKLRDTIKELHEQNSALLDIIDTLYDEISALVDKE